MLSLYVTAYKQRQGGGERTVSVEMDGSCDHKDNPWHLIGTHRKEISPCNWVI